MPKLTQTGSFRGVVNDWGLTSTKDTDLPQLWLHLKAQEIWDVDAGEWLDYSDEDESIETWQCLVSKAGKPTFSYDSAMEVFSWDGHDFMDLANGDYSDLVIQFRVVDNDPAYAEKNPFQVDRIDVADATPGSGVKKLDDDGIAAMNAKYAMVLKKSGKKVTAKSVADKAPKPRTRRAKDSAKDPVVTATEKQAKLEAKAKKNQERLKAEAEAKTTPRARPGTGEFTMPETYTGTPCNGDQAWASICASAEEHGTDDSVVDALMLTACKEVAGNDKPDSDSFTDPQWGEVVGKTLDAIAAV